MEPNKMDEKRLAVLKDRPNNPLVISLVFSILAGVIICCLIAQELSEKGTKGEFANSIFFALLFLSGGIILLWKQIQRIDRRLDAIVELLPVELEEDHTSENIESESEPEEEEEEEEEEEDDDDEDEEIEEEEKNGKNLAGDKKSEEKQE